ncbi:MAG: anti-sigma factor, partial [Massilia sp.]
MRFSDETIMAFADGELGEPERSALEQAVKRDPALAAQVARHQALREDVFGAFAGVLDEPVPARLQPA